MMVPDLDELERTFLRIKDLPGFRPDQRIWWIYMRNAAIEVTSRNDLPGLQQACDPLKAFPENLPHEAARWLALRGEVANVLGRYEGEM